MRIPVLEPHTLPWTAQRLIGTLNRSANIDVLVHGSVTISLHI